MCFNIDRKTLDRLLVYQTVKIVRFENAKIGGLYYCLVAAITFYILGYQLLYCNEHFDKRGVLGTPRLSIQEPTAGGCDPRLEGCRVDVRPSEALPYCEGYAGGPGEPGPEARRPCVFADRHTLLPHGAIAGELLLPTRLERMTQARSCAPGAANNYSCGGEFEAVEEPGPRYVADVERFSVLISHSYRRDSLSGNNNRVPGYYLECEESRGRRQRLEAAVFGAEECPGRERLRPIECLDDSCHFPGPGEAVRSTPLARPALLHRGLRGAGAGAGHWALREDGVYAVPDGDVFAVAKLLELAGVTSLDGEANLDGQPLREVGIVLDIAVRYRNLRPIASTFGGGDVEYEYLVSVKPVHEAADESVVASDVRMGRRVVEKRHGIYFTVRVEGDFGFFSLMNLVLALAQGATMLAVATVITDKITVYLLEDADENYHAKYKEVERKDRHAVDVDCKQK